MTISISELEAIERAMTQGEWEVWTSNSHRRVTAYNGPDGGVLCGSIQQHDGHPDIAGLNRDNDLAGIVAARNSLPALLAIANAALAAREAHNESYGWNDGGAHQMRCQAADLALDRALDKVTP